MNYLTGEFMKEITKGFVIAAAVCLGFVALVASPASAQPYVAATPQGAGAVLSSTGGQQPVGAVLSSADARPAALPFQVSGSAATATPRASAQGLAFTGADIATLVTVALAAMTLGVVLTRRARPRAES